MVLNNRKGKGFLFLTLFFQINHLTFIFEIISDHENPLLNIHISPIYTKI